MLLTDASFENAVGLKSYLGYVFLTIDDDGRCNKFHCCSNKCRNIGSSIMVAEVKTLVLGFNYVYPVQEFSQDMIGRTFALEAMTNLKAVFDVARKRPHYGKDPADRRLCAFPVVRYRRKQLVFCRFREIKTHHNPQLSRF